MPKNRRYGAKNLGCRADFFVLVNGVLDDYRVLEGN